MSEFKIVVSSDHSRPLSQTTKDPVKADRIAMRALQGAELYDTITFFYGDAIIWQVTKTSPGLNSASSLDRAREKRETPRVLSSSDLSRVDGTSEEGSQPKEET